jgi:hypothetical protein
MRLLEDRLTASDCALELEIDIPPSSRPWVAKNRLKAMRLWIERFLDGSVAFSTGTEIDTTMFEKISNHVMMCPEEPHDYLLLVLIHSKLMAICGDEVLISATSLHTDTGEGFSNTAEGTTEDWLPTMAEWIGPRHFHEVPWWNRSDSSMMDLRPEDDDDLSNKPELGIDLIGMVSADGEPAKEELAPVAEIIKPSFKPRIITADD